jgi:hypothetical protein
LDLLAKCSTPRYVVFNEVLLTSAKFMRDITAVEPGWLSELAPHFYDYKITPDAGSGGSAGGRAAKKPRV